MENLILENVKCGMGYVIEVIDKNVYFIDYQGIKCKFKSKYDLSVGDFVKIKDCVLLKNKEFISEFDYFYGFCVEERVKTEEESMIEFLKRDDVKEEIEMEFLASGCLSIKEFIRREFDKITKA